MLTAIGDVMREAYKRGWITTRDGNCSVRMRNRPYLYITPSGVRKTIIHPESVIKIKIKGDELIVSGNVFVQGTLDAHTKNFKIDHPTKEGYYLIHSSLEGAERGIYHRGKLENINIIELPDYWEELADEINITVQLTPAGNACQHYIKSINRSQIVVGCDCGKPNCHYIVYAERTDQGKFKLIESKE